MSAIRTQDIIAYAGGQAWPNYGTFTRRTNRLARFGESGKETFTRADAQTCASYLGGDGLYHLAAAGVLRPHWIDTNGDGIVDTLTFLSEPTATNRLVQANTLATTWVASNVTATNAAGAGPDGVTTSATKLVPTTTNTAVHKVTQDNTITANEFLAVRGWFAAAGYTGILLRVSDTTETHGFNIAIDLGTGTITLAANAFGTGVTLSGSLVRALAGGYEIQIWGSLGNGITTARVVPYVSDTGAHAANLTAFAGDGVSGILGTELQLERNGAQALPPTTPIVTVASTLTRAADACTVPVAADTEACSLYMKFQERGGIQMASGAPVVGGLGTFVALPALNLYQSGGKYSARLRVAAGGGTSYVVSAAAAPNFLDLVELVGTYDGVGTVTLTQAINGGAGVTTTVAAAAPGSTVWGTAALGFLNDGAGGAGCPGALVRGVLVDGVHTLAEFQAVP